MPRWGDHLVMTRKSYLFFLLALIFIAAACSDDQREVSTDFELVRHSVWILNAFDSAGIFLADVLPNDSIRLLFQDLNRFEGSVSGSCINTYGGGFTLGPGGTIHFDQIFTTKRGCMNGSRYGDYWGRLHSVTSFCVNAAELTLYCGDLNTRMQFNRIR